MTQQVWWREDPLTATEEQLLQSVVDAHQKSTYRENASTMAVVNTALASGDLSKAIAAGIMNLGGNHAPLEQTHEFLSLECPEMEVEALLKSEQKVPGWGNTFVRGTYDPLWLTVHELLQAQFPAMSIKIDSVTNTLAGYGKHVFPNPSAYTAAAAIILGLPAKLVVYLFIRARLDAWAHIAARTSILKGEVT